MSNADIKNRISAALGGYSKSKSKAFITYLTAGLPDYGTTKDLIRAQERGGVDAMELGIPFSDPTADGPVIQEASQEAIKNGASLKKTFEMVKELRSEGCDLPFIFMLYYNTVYHYGVEAFVNSCEEVGVDGFIIPDLPFEEQDEIDNYLRGKDTPILIQLISPVSGDRIPMIAREAKGFIYCVSSMGVTGQDDGFYATINEYLTSVKEASDVPVMMGFGIKTAKDVEPMKDIVDGAIVGSYFLKLMKKSGYDPKTAEEYVRKFKEELNGKP